MTEPVAPLGRVVATEKKPNTPHEFHFWTSLDSPVGIGTIVRVDGPVRVNGGIPRIYGTVIEGFSYTDLQTPLHDVLGADGQPGAPGRHPTARTEIRLYTAAVLRHIPEDPLQPVQMGEVHLADRGERPLVDVDRAMIAEMRVGRDPAGHSAATQRIAIRRLGLAPPPAAR